MVGSVVRPLFHHITPPLRSIHPACFTCDSALGLPVRVLSVCPARVHESAGKEGILVCGDCGECGGGEQ